MPVSKREVTGRRDIKHAAATKDPTTDFPKQTPPKANSPSANSGMIGARLRARRLEHGVSLRQFARDLDVSASFISQLETGKAQPSVATLFSVCTALGISIDELFEGVSGDDASDESREREAMISQTDAGSNSWLKDSALGILPEEHRPGASVDEKRQPSPVVRPQDRKVLVLDSGVTWESLTAFHRERTDFLFVRYEVGGSSTMEGRLIRHVGTEYGFVLTGVLEVTLGFETYRLVTGDSISFDSTRPHRLTNVGDVPVEAIWFNLERFESSH